MTRSLLFVGSLVALCHSSAHAQQAIGLPALDEVLTRDATLRDIAFVDARHGWAVGDRGVLLRTTDGGRRWNRVETHVDCPLYAVTFADARHGWIVGGFTKPYTHSSHGVVLRTEDGGESWRKMPADTLPLLRRVQFFDQRNGVAAGAGASFAPGGLFVTQDGGRSWRPLPADRISHWQAAHFITPDIGVLAGAAGDLATLARREVRRSPILVGDRRGLNDVRLIGPTGGWLVGDGGLVLTTTDLGRTWRPPSAALPTAASSLCDWQSVATIGKHVWIAGAPGSIVLYSPDGGASWQLQPTGITAPLDAITFVDERLGWAAGALGTILVTNDGGRTWQVQRRGGGRTSVALLAPTAESIPVDFVASLAAAEGYFTSLDVLFGSAVGSAAEKTPAAVSARLAELASRSGATTASVGWRLAMSPHHRSLTAEQLLASLNRQTDGQAETELEKQIVTRLRTLRPDLVMLSVGSDPSAMDEASTPHDWSGAERIVEAVARRAVEAAADPTRYVELTSCGLSPHEVKRLVTIAPAPPRAQPRLATGDFESLLGTSPAQWVGSARGLLRTNYKPPPAAITWRVLQDQTAAPAGGRNPMAGIAISRGSAARRAAASPPAGELATLQALARKRRNMQELLRHRAGDQRWMGLAVNLTSGLDADSGAELLIQLADGYRQTGELDLAADTYYLLARRYTEHPLADSAIVWLLRYYASSEVGHVLSAGVAQRFASTAPLANVTGGSPRTTEEPKPLEVPTSDGDALSREERLERASQLGKYLEQARPALFADPAVRFPIATTQRGLGFSKSAQKYVVVLAKQAVAADWRRCAEAERWLGGGDHPSGNRLPPEKPIATCLTTSQRPLLDGQLDEACWQSAEPIRVGASASNSADAEVKVARDEEFLYLAIDCKKRGGVDYAPTTGPRPRDGNLARHDRVSLRFDLDRDYITALELTIDSRGWTADRCWGGAKWDPQWFVSASQTADRWTAEAAIPLTMLTSSAIRPRQSWAISVVRTSPGAAPESWTGVASEESPDRFGLLRFR